MLEVFGIVAVVIVFGGALILIWKTKAPGFGPYSTSVLVLVLVLFVASLASVSQKIDFQPLVSILLAVAGFAGGLLTAREKDDKSK